MIDWQKRLQKREERFAELDRLKSEFVSTVSHELRTPSAIQQDGQVAINVGDNGRGIPPEDMLANSIATDPGPYRIDLHLLDLRICIRNNSTSRTCTPTGDETDLLFDAPRSLDASAQSLVQLGVRVKSELVSKFS